MEEDEITKRIRGEFDAIINSDSKYKRQPLKEEKKTILDELNKDYLVRFLKFLCACHLSCSYHAI